jgi:hypothetical protein
VLRHELSWLRRPDIASLRASRTRM